MGGVTGLAISGSPSWPVREALDASDGRHDSGGGVARSRAGKATVHLLVSRVNVICSKT